MYLSRNWDLSEMSAINKGGQSNLANKTVFEDEEEFQRQQVCIYLPTYIHTCEMDGARGGSDDDDDDDDDNDHILTDICMYVWQEIQQKLEEKRKRDEELRMTIDGQEKALADGKDAAPIDYSLYQTFWGLQVCLYVGELVGGQ